MSTDVNDFDSYLKERLHRDLMFRALIWLGISLATAWLALHGGANTPASYFERAADSVAPLVNTIGTFGLLICLVALLLKDLEAVSMDEKIKAHTRALPAGVVRRLAGDITLWTLGALLAMIAALAVACFSSDLSAQDRAETASLFLMLLGIGMFTAVCNILVRRSGPTPLAREFRDPIVLVLTYLAAIAVVILVLVGRAF